MKSLAIGEIVDESISENISERIDPLLVMAAIGGIRTNESNIVNNPYVIFTFLLENTGFQILINYSHKTARLILYGECIGLYKNLRLNEITNMQDVLVVAERMIIAMGSY